MKISAIQSSVECRKSRAKDRHQETAGVLPSTLGSRPSSAFTMVEIAICLAIIGIALVAIIGVLPIGINVQKDNREETLVNQDATVFVNAIRNGARGLDDLTNYVYAIGITNMAGVNNAGYINPVLAGQMNFSETRSFPTVPPGQWYPILTNGANIIGLLSTPEYVDNNGVPLLNLVNGGISNQVVAFVRSLSGPAVALPPQNNDIIVGDSFGYKMICDNVPVAVNTPPVWQAQAYNAGDQVLYNGVSWRATTTTLPTDTPGEPSPSPWAQDSYIQQLAANLHELRLTFLWPLLPNGSVGHGLHTFATTVAGQMEQTNINVNGPWLYFFQPQSFTSAP